MSNTRDAGDFVLVEETAVSKGVRRVVGVTGDVAMRCREKGAEMEGLVVEVGGRASGMDGGKEADLVERAVVGLRKEVRCSKSRSDELSRLLFLTSLLHYLLCVSLCSSQLDAAVISSPLKTDLRARLEKVQKSVAQSKKAEAGRRLNDVLTGVRERVVGADLVAEAFEGIDGKAGQKIVEAVKKVNPDCAFFGVIKGEEGKAMAFCSVPEGRDRKASDWLKEVLGKFGGRGGGTDVFASGQCQIEGDAGLDEVVEASKGSF